MLGYKILLCFTVSRWEVLVLTGFIWDYGEKELENCSVLVGLECGH